MRQMIVNCSNLHSFTVNITPKNQNVITKCKICNVVLGCSIYVTSSTCDSVESCLFVSDWLATLVIPHAHVHRYITICSQIMTFDSYQINMSSTWEGQSLPTITVWYQRWVELIFGLAKPCILILFGSPSLRSNDSHVKTVVSNTLLELELVLFLVSQPTDYCSSVILRSWSQIDSAGVK